MRRRECSVSDKYKMREPCRLCGSNDGYIEERSGTELCRLRRLQFVGLQLTKTPGLRMTNDSGGRLGEATLNYAKRDWHVFPLHKVAQGSCSCGQDCESPAKHPRGDLVPRGLNDGTTDLTTITKMRSNPCGRVPKKKNPICLGADWTLGTRTPLWDELRRRIFAEALDDQDDINESGVEGTRYDD